MSANKHMQRAGTHKVLGRGRSRLVPRSAPRARTLATRGLDFEDAALVFEGLTVEVEDARKDYGESRIICFGLLEGRLVVVGYTQRGEDQHVFSMRKANGREKKRLAAHFKI